MHLNSKSILWSLLSEPFTDIKVNPQIPKHCWLPGNGIPNTVLDMDVIDIHSFSLSQGKGGDFDSMC